MTPRLERINCPSDFSDFSEIVDVRSPSEFELDHIKGAINLPVLFDDEHREIGTLYRTSPFKARKRGAAWVSTNIGRHMSNHFASKPRDYHPLIYCWRGGQRSGSLASVLSEIGWSIFILEGGYKAYRRMVSAVIEERSQAIAFHVVNGLTGSGKTLLLHAVRRLGAQVLDLENLANHRGSLFGGDLVDAQPTQKRFESLLFDQLAAYDTSQPVYVEAESPKIGFINLPSSLWQKLKESPVVEIRCPLPERARYLVGEYKDWQDQPARVLDTIARLSPFHPAEQIAEWQRLTSQKDWQALTASLLEHHYDRRYGAAGTGHYEKPLHTLNLDNHEKEAVSSLGRKIVELSPPGS